MFDRRLVFASVIIILLLVVSITMAAAAQDSKVMDCEALANSYLAEPEGYAEQCLPDRPDAPEPSPAPLGPTDTAFAQDIGFVSDNFVSHDLNDFPGQTIVGPNARPIFAMDFNPAATILYAIDNVSRELGTINLATGAFNVIAVVSGIPVADNISGLTIAANGTAYVSGLGTGMTLYTMNLGTGVATAIGNDPARTLMIDIAINCQGQMYGHDIGDDSIYTINTSTGLATLVGPTGVDSNFAQGMDFDFSDGTLYAYTYQGGGANQYGTINLNTGALMPLATDNPLGEFEGAVQTICAGGSDPDIHVNPTSLASTQVPDRVRVKTLTLSNLGGANLTWDIYEEPTVPDQVAGRSDDVSKHFDPTAPKSREAIVEMPNEPAGELIQDGSFEDGTPNPFWNEFSTNFGTPLCDEASCGNGGGSSLPRTGAWWAWFGGIGAFERGWVEQDLTIPPEATALSFCVWNGAESGNGTDWLNAQIDGNVEWSIIEGNPIYTSGYVRVVIDLAAGGYNDGGTHTIRFESEVSGLGGTTNFSLDDVSLNAGGDCDTTSNIPWLSVSPTGGTISPSGSRDLDVTFNSSGLIPGIYNGDLCIESNDPDEPVVRVPVRMTVNPPSLGGYVFLPLMTTPEPCFPGPWESEPNDSRAQANGPLCLGVQYMGSPNDGLPGMENDYFYFDLPASGQVTVLVTNFLPVGQLQLITPSELIYLADQANGTYQIQYNGPAGRYTVRLVALAGHPVGQNYTLRVTRP